MSQKIELKKLNPKNHALMRYLTRKHKLIIAGDAAYKMWKDQNPNLVEIGERELIELSGKCEIVFSGKYNKDNTEREYRIDLTSKSILVCDKNSIITYYPVEFGDGITEEANTQIFIALLQSRERLLTAIEEYNEQISSETEDLNGQLRILNQEILVKENELNVLKNKRDEYKAQIETLKSQLPVLISKLDNVQSKIASPKYSFHE